MHYRRDRGRAGAFGSSTGTRRPRDPRRLALAEGSWFWWGRAWRFLRFDGKVGGEPFWNSAFEHANLDPLPQQFDGHVRADQLVRVGIVGDDVAAAGDCDGVDGVR